MNDTTDLVSTQIDLIKQAIELAELQAHGTHLATCHLNRFTSAVTLRAGPDGAQFHPDHGRVHLISGGNVGFVDQLDGAATTQQSAVRAQLEAAKKPAGSCWR